MPRRKFEVNCYHILGKHSLFLPETSALGKLVELQVKFLKRQRKHLKSQEENYEISVWFMYVSVCLCLWIILLRLIVNEL